MLKFLKECPDKYLLLIIFVMVFASYLALKNDFLATLTRDLVVAILTILGVRRHQSNQSNDIDAENVNFGSDQSELKEN